MKVATMATGGIGGFLAVRLGKEGHQIATIARGDHLSTIANEGLLLQGFNGDEMVQPWIATDDPAQVGPVDAIIFGVKGDGLEAAARACLPMIGSETLVIPFLNGVEAADRLCNILPPQNVGNGVAQISTTIAAPGVIGQTGAINRFIFAERDSRPSARIDTLRDAFNTAGTSAPPTDDIVRDLWMKFILFSAVSGVTAAARTTMGEVMENAALSGLYRAIMAETTRLGRASGVALPETAEDDLWKAAQAWPSALRASTAIDLEQGRALEIEWVSGAVVRLSRKLGLEAPCNEAVYAILSPYRHGRGQENG